MKELDALVSISRYYGVNPDYVIAGGGNTSYKNDNELFIKASGIALADIDSGGFVKMSRERLGIIESREYTEEAVTREEEVKTDLNKAIVSPAHLRPSVETSLHNLINYRYVVHTHPTLVNAMMCANNAEQEVAKRFGSEALYMPYTDPGYILFKELQGKVKAYEDTFKKAPKIIFLQNHGIFVAAESANEIKVMYDSIGSRIMEGKDLSLPDHRISEWRSDKAGILHDLFAKRNLRVQAIHSPLIAHFASGKDMYRKISRPFTPDIIVYCKSHYLFLEKDMDRSGIEEKLAAFESAHGYPPRVILEELGGMIAVEESEKSLHTVFEVFQDMMKISFLSEQFGGPHFMSEEQIRFIDSWEVENYRRRIARKE